MSDCFSFGVAVVLIYVDLCLFMLIFKTVQWNLKSDSIQRAARTSEIDVSGLRISAKVCNSETPNTLIFKFLRTFTDN